MRARRASGGMVMGGRLPVNTVRGRVRQFIERHAHLLGDDVLEVGSRGSERSWWINNRDLASAKWLGVDFQEGVGVDMVADVHRLPHEWKERFSGVLCSEVLEHVQRPWVAVPEMFRVIRPGGWIVTTTPFGFPIHGYPDDYYRYTPSGIATLLSDAGFVDIETSTGGNTPMTLYDHDLRQPARRDLVMHVFAVARKPE